MLCPLFKDEKMQFNPLKQELIYLVEKQQYPAALDIIEQIITSDCADIQVLLTKAKLLILLQQPVLALLDPINQQHKNHISLTILTAIAYENSNLPIKSYQQLAEAAFACCDQQEADIYQSQIKSLTHTIQNSLTPQNCISTLNEIHSIAKRLQQLHEVDNYYQGLHFITTVGKSYNNKFIAVRQNIADPRYNQAQSVEIIERSNNNIIKANAIVPILSTETDNIVSISNPATQTTNQYHLAHNVFSYFNLQAGDVIEGNDKTVIGKPVIRQKQHHLQDLVLTIFVDGLSQSILDQYGFETLMPNTARYFKQAVKCCNAYVNGEWTLVSIANFTTGLYTSEHGLHHPTKLYKFNKNQPTLFQTFNQAGYYTAKIDFDWRSNFSCGYVDGIDRQLYGAELAQANNVIFDTIEHISTFKDTNQYVWLSLIDLHNVADGFKSPLANEANEQPQEKSSHSDYSLGQSSVRQHYSLAKTHKYCNQIKWLDQQLENLYHYLEQHFDNQKVTVSLISDHGQGYLVQDHLPMLSNCRIKVPLLFKSEQLRPADCHDIIEAVDYPSIMYKLANIEPPTTVSSGQLPTQFGGQQYRQYAYSETLHPGQPYRATITTADYQFFLVTTYNVLDNGTVNLSYFDSQILTLDYQQQIDDSVIMQYCIDIVMQHMQYRRIYDPVMQDI